MRFRLTKDEVSAVEKAINEYLLAERADKTAGARMSVLRAIGIDVPQRFDTHKRQPRSQEFREQAAQRLRERWQNNADFRAARLEGVQAYWRRRKEGAPT